MNAPVNQKEIGLYNKFNVTRTDGKDAPGEKHHGDEYFVLNTTTDKHAIPALATYADACEAEYPALAADLRAKIAYTVKKQSEFITVPEVTLPCGTVVPSFKIMQYLAGKGLAGMPISTADAAPWVEISYFDAMDVTEKAGYQRLTALQSLALDWDIYQQDANWTGGKVGEGELLCGIRNGNVSSAQPGTYISNDESEQRWLTLSNGSRICDLNGNVCQWVHDDVQGDENGIIARNFAKDSPSIITPPYPIRTKGMGDYEVWDWSCYALLRGGYWVSGPVAGVFRLGLVGPGRRGVDVGFRCTKSL